VPTIAHESQLFLLVPLCVFPAAEDKPELAARGELGSKVGEKRLRGREGVVDRYLPGSLDVGELGRATSECPFRGWETASAREDQWICVAKRESAMGTHQMHASAPASWLISSSG
jgi:hypothetical protein